MDLYSNYDNTCYIVQFIRQRLDNFHKRQLGSEKKGKFPMDREFSQSYDSSWNYRNVYFYYD
jgi:hypothetical protein